MTLQLLSKQKPQREKVGVPLRFATQRAEVYDQAVGYLIHNEEVRGTQTMGYSQFHTTTLQGTNIETIH